MAQRTKVTLVDDVDGSDADETVKFGLDGATYEIDLTAVHAGQLRGAFATYQEHGRRAPGAGTRAERQSRPPRDYDPAAVRAWAGANGVAVPRRGRMPKAVIEQFHASGH